MAQGYARRLLVSSYLSDATLGTREKPKKNQALGDVKTRGLRALWKEQCAELVAQPFDVLTPVAGTFNFDARGAWTGIDAGYSPNDQKHGVATSPTVEILAAIGLENARPDEFKPREVRYGVWGVLLPPALARPALGGASLPIPIRRFRFTLDRPSQYSKVVTFAQED